MNEETYLSKALDAASTGNAKYDENVKYLLADKQVLARLLKYAVEEFADMTIEDIILSIGSDVEIGAQPIEPGMTNLGRVTESNTEDNVPNEGKIFFDIRFTAYHRKEAYKILLNVEAQKSSETYKIGYHIENRIIFYLSRMISAQKQTEFFHSDYDELKRVRSIWICMDGGKNGDSIEEIRLTQKNIFGQTVLFSNLDLIRGIVIRIRSMENVEESKNELISMLEDLLSQEQPAAKKDRLKSRHGMILTTELERRLDVMCNLSAVIEEKGIEKGIEQERMSAIERMIKANFTKEQIISLGYREEEIVRVRNGI